MLVATITPWSFKWRMKQSVAKKPDTKMNDSQASVLFQAELERPITNDGLAIGSCFLSNNDQLIYTVIGMMHTSLT